MPVAAEGEAENTGVRDVTRAGVGYLLQKIAENPVGGVPLGGAVAAAGATAAGAARVGGVLAAGVVEVPDEEYPCPAGAGLQVGN